MRAREWKNLGYHLVAGAALSIPPLLSPWGIVLGTFVYATLREQAQHRYILLNWSIDPGSQFPLYRVEKRTFWDWSWFKWHHAFEIGQWTVGSALGVAACVFGAPYLWRLYLAF